MTSPLARLGETNPNAKLTTSQVVQIRVRYHAGEALHHLAAEYGLTHRAISNLANGRTWSHVGGPIKAPGQIGAGKGEHNPNAKLTAAQAIEIRKRYARGALIRTLAADYDVTPIAIKSVVTGRTWKHVGGPIQTGRRRGLRSTKGLLAEGHIVGMRERSALGETTGSLAADYGLSASTVRRILHGHIWPEAGGPIKTPGRKGRDPRKEDQ